MQAKKLTKYPLIAVYWDDAESDTGWEEVPDDLHPTLALTVGFLIKETESHLLIAGSIDLDNLKHTNDRTQIPKGMVREVRNLSIGKPRV